MHALSGLEMCVAVCRNVFIVALTTTTTTLFVMRSYHPLAVVAFALRFYWIRLPILMEREPTDVA